MPLLRASLILKTPKFAGCPSLNFKDPELLFHISPLWTRFLGSELLPTVSHYPTTRWNNSISSGTPNWFRSSQNLLIDAFFLKCIPRIYNSLMASALNWEKEPWILDPCSRMDFHTFRSIFLGKSAAVDCFWCFGGLKRIPRIYNSLMARALNREKVALNVRTLFAYRFLHLRIYILGEECCCWLLLMLWGFLTFFHYPEIFFLLFQKKRDHSYLVLCSAIGFGWLFGFGFLFFCCLWLVGYFFSFRSEGRINKVWKSRRIY